MNMLALVDEALDDGQVSAELVPSGIDGTLLRVDQFAQLFTTLHTDLILDTLEMGSWTRTRVGRDLSQLIHHSDHGLQYRATRYTERLVEAEAVPNLRKIRSLTTMLPARKERAPL